MRGRDATFLHSFIFDIWNTVPETTSLKMEIFPRYNKAEIIQGENTQTEYRRCLAHSGLPPEGLMLHPQVTKVCLGFSKNWVWLTDFNFSWTWKQPAQPFQPQTEKTKPCQHFGDFYWDSERLVGSLLVGGGGSRDRVPGHGDSMDRAAGHICTARLEKPPSRHQRKGIIFPLHTSGAFYKPI